jgi:UDP-N-acetylmuramoyl-L-alanyl-D-glutamate--2,6-diaminopimelate ligase
MMVKRKSKGRAYRLPELLSALDIGQTQDMQNLDVRGIKSDSRTVEPGDVFVAVRGSEVDGHRFVADAVERGAVACVTEQAMDTGTAFNVVVVDSAKALAVLASEFHGNPSRGLHMIGVTGTNGKTSTAHLLRAICEQSSWGRMGLIGTVGHGTGTQLEASVHTTPEPIALHQLLGDMKGQDCVGVVMEVSSHAVRQQRIWGLDFEIGMLTNVTRDHLDYHATFDDYVDAKREFCHSLIADERQKKPGTLVYSIDNDYARKIGEGFPGKKVSTSTREVADVYAKNVEPTLNRTRFTLCLSKDQSVTVDLKLLGSFSASNAAMAAAAARELGIGGEEIRAGLESVRQVPGRFEALGGGLKPLVIVDYSHTPDSLELTLEFCRALKPTRLITVFGCGGDRDRGKRPLMGGIAQEYSDACYVTSDNPRTEDPLLIIEHILDGMDRESDDLVVEPDRGKAIHGAIHGAQSGDIVAVCGKGHEDYQIIGAVRHHFDDREEAEHALSTWSST